MVPDLAFRLIKNAIRFRYLKLTGKAVLPQAVSLEITHRCIAKCIMCNIWKIKDAQSERSVSDWLSLIKQGYFKNVRELDITGGEPFLREDITSFFKELIELRQEFLPELRSVAITSNGLLTDKVVSGVSQILDILQPSGIGLVIVCALDAVGPLHDQIRNYKNAWEKLNETLRQLITLREKTDNLIIGVKTTILPQNVNELDRIADFAETHNLFTIISPYIITAGRYLNDDKESEFRFSDEDRKKLIRFYRSNRFHWDFHGNALADFFETGVIDKPCTCGFNYVFIRSNGDLYLCPLVNQKAGNVFDRPIRDVYFSETAKKIRKQIGSFSDCRQCTEPGLERYSLPFEGKHYLGMMLNMTSEKFLQLHEHMGLDKYL